ncbi:MAG TPA: hypothetical protein VF669_22905 [Tepidisphaeraceae bacterium]|jgi:hypothetical protein
MRQKIICGLFISTILCASNVFAQVIWRTATHEIQTTTRRELTSYAISQGYTQPDDTVSTNTGPSTIPWSYTTGIAINQHVTSFNHSTFLDTITVTKEYTAGDGPFGNIYIYRRFGHDYFTVNFQVTSPVKFTYTPTDTFWGVNSALTGSNGQNFTLYSTYPGATGTLQPGLFTLTSNVTSSGDITRGQAYTFSVALPEPAAIGALALATLLLGRRRRAMGT